MYSSIWKEFFFFSIDKTRDKYARIDDSDDDDDDDNVDVDDDDDKKSNKIVQQHQLYRAISTTYRILQKPGRCQHGCTFKHRTYKLQNH